MATVVKRMYCTSCGEEVETFVMLDKGGENYHCFICGANLGADRGAASGPELKPLEMMLVAEDSMVFREVLKDKVMELNLARDLALAKDGEEFLALFTYRLAHDKPVSLAVLDIKMPGLNGVNAAMAMRAVERGLDRSRPVPILFFSSLRCDETLKEVFKHCAPSRYINKGASSSPEDLADRLVEVIKLLISESKGK